jgi:hypothetical protein
VTDPADLTHAVLLRVAEFLRKLPADQLADLAEGMAKLEVVPKGGRPAPSRAAATATAAKSSVPVDQVREELAAQDDRAAASQYLDGLKLTVAALRSLAAELNIAVPSKANKNVVRDTIIFWTVGRRIDSAAVSRPAPTRS